MDENRRGKIYACIFFVFLLFLIIGGYITTKYLTKEKPKEEQKTESKEEVKDLRIDKTKEYIYFDSPLVVSKTQSITYQNIVFNITNLDLQDVADKLNQESREYQKSLKKISEMELDEEEQNKIIYKEDDIYEAKSREYTRYFYNNYASLLVNDFNFDCINGKIFQSTYAYVFDTLTGKILDKKALMDQFSISLDTIKKEVKEKLEKEQKIENEEPLIDITATLTGLDNEENYALYVNKSGTLVISYLVKSSKNNYNDVIILNEGGKIDE